MGNNVAVVAAHPDDEVLGCGGTIARHSRAGDDVHVLILAEGITSRSAENDHETDLGELSQLAEAARHAGDVLGVNSLTLEHFADNRLDSYDRLDLIKRVEAFFAAHAPAVVYTHHGGDLNVDHRRVHQAVVTAARPLPRSPIERVLGFEVVSSTEWQPAGSATPFLPNWVLGFEVVSSTEWQPAGSATPFLPNWFVDISETLKLKLEALDAYSGEMRDWPHARSIKAVEHLARWRGSMVGSAAAEAFVLAREVER